MNLPQTTTQTKVSPDTRIETGTKLRGRWLLLARAVWAALVALTLLIFLASIPVFDAQLLQRLSRLVCNEISRKKPH
jgi:hypothetical protein